MGSIICYIIALFLVGVVLISGKSANKIITREKFLGDLAKFLEGTLDPIEDGIHDNAFRIQFIFDGENFVYEDLEKPSFRDKVYFAVLKVKAPGALSLTFAAKRRSMKVRTDIFLASEISSQQAGKNIQLQVPPYLKDMNVFTNDTRKANRILNDNRISSMFKNLKNTDTRGYSSLPIEIVDGMVSLAFSSEAAFKPNLAELKTNIPSIEDYASKLMVIVRRLKEKV